MKHNTFRFTLVAMLVFIIGGCGSTDPDTDGVDAAIPAHWAEGLESGVNWGLAQKYSMDLGISKNQYVLGAEDFETGVVTIKTEENRYLKTVTVVDNISYTGTYCSQFDWPEGLNGPTTRFIIPQSAHDGDHSTYFVRMYFNFDNSFHPGGTDQQAGVGVKGLGIEADDGHGNNINIPCDGTNWYNAQVQFVGWGPSVKPQANNGYLWVGHLYSYNPYPEKAVAQFGKELEISSPAAGDKPYRFSSYADPFFYIDFGGWHCYEVGMFLNMPGKADGEARFWIDGVLQSRVVNIRYRDVASLLPTAVNLNLHRVTADFEHTMTRWTDNIVIATRYIGPVAE